MEARDVTKHSAMPGIAPTIKNYRAHNTSGAKTEKPVVLSLFIKKRKYYGLVKQSGDFILRLELSGFPSSSGVKNLPATRETWVQSLGQ